MVDPARLTRLRGLETHLAANIRGQAHLLPRVASGFSRAALALTDSARPGASFLLVGPTGTGKSKTFADACAYTFGLDRLVTFDMSEYQDHLALGKMLGASRDDPGMLGRALSLVPSGALLFDELEKAHGSVIDLFLQMLERGCITIATGQVHRLGGYVVGFTSNVGATEAMRMTHSSFASIEQATLRRLERILRPELLGRIDEKLVFAGLSPAVQNEICALEVTAELSRLRQQGYDLTISKDAMEFLAREGFHPLLGARPLRKMVGSQIQNAVLRSLYSWGFARGEIVPDIPSSQLEVRANE